MVCVRVWARARARARARMRSFVFVCKTYMEGNLHWFTNIIIIWIVTNASSNV